MTATVSRRQSRNAIAALSVVTGTVDGDFDRIRLVMCTFPPEDLIQGLVLLAAQLRDRLADVQATTPQQVDQDTRNHYLRSTP